MTSETKLDNSFPERQFLIPGYSSPYRFDRICRVGRYYVVRKRRYTL